MFHSWGACAPRQDERRKPPYQKQKHQRNFQHKVKTNRSVDRLLPSDHEAFIND